MIEIRGSKPEEFQDARTVHEAAFAKHHATYHARPADAARQAARLREGVRVVALDGGKIIGTVQYVEHKDHVHVLDLAVLPGFQNRGIARRLIEWVAQTTVRLGYHRLVTDTIEETGNVALYEHLGFRVIDRTNIDQFESDVHDSLHIVKLEKCLCAERV